MSLLLSFQTTYTNPIRLTARFAVRQQDSTHKHNRTLQTGCFTKLPKKSIEMMRSFFSTAAAALALFLFAGTSCEAFSSVPKANKVNFSTTLQMKTVNSDDRRAFLSKVATASAAITAATFFPSVPQPALAFGGALNKVNGKLSAYGLPQLKDVPGGFSPLLELYGKAKNRKPLLVEFLFPSDWVVVLPNVDVNGEEGTIQAGQYSAGDTATFFVVKDAEKVEVR